MATTMTMDLANGSSGSDQDKLINGASMAPHAPEVVSKVVTKRRGGQENAQFELPRFMQELEAQLVIDEGEPMRLLSRVAPADDSSLTVQWFKNGKPLSTGSRFSTIMDRGFLVLDIIYTIEDDCGEYVCVASSNAGSAESNKASVTIVPESGLVSQSQIPADMMQNINDLDQSLAGHNRDQHLTEDRHASKSPPHFLDDCSNTFTVAQGNPLHLEVFVEPQSDASLHTEWFKDGKSLTSGSRINSIYDRGYCSLDIAYCYPEDSGNYTCVARNARGQAESLPSTIVCQPEDAVVTKSNLTESSITHLKAFENPGDEFSMGIINAESPVAPEFMGALEPESATVMDGSPASFQVRVNPGNGEKLDFDWYRDDLVIDTCSRLTGKLEMNVASLHIQYTLPGDSGRYKCVVFTEHGRAETDTASLCVETEHSVVSAPQSKGIGAIQALEAELNAPRHQREQDDTVTDAPSFSKQLEPVGTLSEGDAVTLMARVEPVRDNSLYVDWYKNEEQLMNGARFRIEYERGVASLTITSVIAEDSGEYWISARSKNGQSDSLRVTVSCSATEGIVTKSSLLEDSEGFRRIKEMEEDLANVNLGFSNVEDVETECAPTFDVKPMSITVGEGCPAKFLVKVGGFPRPTLQWSIEGVVVVPDSLSKTYNDGSINYLEINRCSELGENEITVVATNPLGQTQASASLTVVQTVNFGSDLRHVTQTDNPFKKMAGLKKVECLPELSSAFQKKTGARSEAAITTLERSGRGSSSGSSERTETERMYDQVASKLRKSTLHSRAGSASRSPTQLQQQQKFFSAAAAAKMNGSTAPLPPLPPAAAPADVAMAVESSPNPVFSPAPEENQ